ncbi:MAG TPA: 2-hydroxyacyl-CoA dehydratase [Dehalococcoidia bacterium]|nr:2-hydroxyacyl-CoA dehydratase [Dehalococcoidia bacterium]
MGKPVGGEHNIWREWTEKYARRIKKIRENPNPKLARSNIILYEMMYNQARRELDAWESGSKVPVMYCNENSPVRLYMSLGFRTYHIEMFADRLTREQARRYFDLARGHGFPENACDRVQLTAGVGISGHLPPPSICATVPGDCDTMAQALLYVGRFWKVPTFAIDIPFEVNIEAVLYVKEQLEQIVDFCQQTFPDYIRYDEARLTELQKLYEETWKLESEIFELSATKPCPVSGRDALRMPPIQLYDDPMMVDYFRSFRDELKERAEQGKSVLKDGVERFRVYWMCSAPFYEDPFSFLEERGCAVPCYEEGPGAPSRYAVRDYEDAERRFGRALRHPLEEEAGVLVTCHWGNVAERRIQEVLRNSQRLGIEGIVHFMQPGCLPCNNMAKVLGERAEKELGIKNIYIEGWCQDMEKHDEAEFEAKLADWLNLCLAEKEAKQKSQ